MLALAPLLGALAPARALAQDAGTFTVSFSGKDASGSFGGACGPYGGPGVRTPADFPGQAPAQQSWSLELDGAVGATGYSLGAVVKPYTGPGAYKGGGRNTIVTGTFSVQNGPLWGTTGPGSSGTLTVAGADERSGSFDWTMAPSPQDPDGTAPLHVTASFDCPLNAVAASPAPAASCSAGSAASAAASDDTSCGEDIFIDHIEVVQVVQTPTNSIPLVADKSTVVRVFVRKMSGPDADQPLTGQLNGFVGGQLQPETLSPMSGGAYVTTGSPSRGSPDGALQFLLPPTWTTENDLQLDAIVDPVAPVTDPDESNNSASVTVTFTDRSTLNVGWHPLCLPALPADPTSCPDDSTMVASSKSWIGPTQEMYPLRDGGFHLFRLPGPAWLYPERITDDASTAKALAWLKSMYSLAADIAFEQGKHGLDQLVGVVSGGGRSTWAGVAIGEDDPKIGKRVLMLGETVDGFVLAHELGHNLGLNHVQGCRQPAGPYDTLASGSSDIGEVGVQIHGTQVTVIRPSEPDVMSYCGSPEWLAPSHYQTLYANDLSPLHLRSQVTATLAAATTPPAGYVVVRGTIRSDGTAGSIDGATAFATDGPPVDLLTATTGAFCISIGPDRRCFDSAFHAEDQQTTSSTSFSVVVPVAANASAIALSTGAGRQIASQKVGAAAPTVTVDPIASTVWSSDQDLTYRVADPDGDPVTAVVLYSPDDGATWLPYGFDPSGKLHIDVSQLQVGTTNRFRILASDGLHTTTADIGPITVPTGVGVADVIPLDAPPPAVAAPVSSAAPIATPDTVAGGSDLPTRSDDTPLIAALALVGLLLVVVAGVVVATRPRRRAVGPWTQVPPAPSTKGPAGPVGPPTAIPVPAVGPSHVVPATGLPAWGAPDAAAAPVAQLPPGTELLLAEALPNGWARVVASNGWTGWVDGRLLVPIAR
jgi:hypothetical protein